MTFREFFKKYPITQKSYSEMYGISPEHLNRVLKGSAKVSGNMKFVLQKFIHEVAKIEIE